MDDLHFDQSLPPVYGVEQRLSPRIGRVLASNPSPFTFRGTGVYIVGAGSKVVVIDPGPDSFDHLAALKAAIGVRTVTHILVTHTHRDHSPAAALLKLATGAKTYGFGPHGRSGESAEEGADVDFVPDVFVKDGDVIAGDDCTFQCVFTPGHTSNHMCYALAEEDALFTGDHVMGWSTTVVAPPDGNMGDYMRSLEKLIARKDRILYPTHGSPIVKPAPFLRAYLSHRRMRETQIARALARGRDTVPLLVESLYAGLAPSLHRAAALTIQAHLKHMEEEGRAAPLPDGRYEASAPR
ncbi:MAG TPA: MBL fold metallo-hydrolase [Rhizomicrobium sp.]|jgi:glyoxylase-like metal-dependent hydrolase (beta-lactamase superfamily II)